MLWRAARNLHHYPWPTIVLAVILAAAGYTVAHTPAVLLDLAGRTAAEATTLAHRLVVLGIVIAATGAAWWVLYWLYLPTTTMAWVDRRDEEADHARGVASRLDIAQYASKAAMRKKATLLRPSLYEVSWWRRRFRVPVTEYAVKLVTAGAIGTTSEVWSSAEDVTARLGGPRSGKTGSMIPHIRTAPGPVVITSTRTDLLHHTRAARDKLGRCLVFNPTGLGHLPSTVRWSPLAGCTDYATAQRRADDLIPPSTGEAERWDSQARGLLAILLHAAALDADGDGPGSIRQISRWLSHPDETTRTDISDALQKSPDADALQTEARAILGTNERTLTSITATLRPAIRWASEATAAEVGDAHLSDPEFFDVAAFVRAQPGSGDLTLDLDRELARLSELDPFTAGPRDTRPEPDGPAVDETPGRRFDSLYMVGREGGCRSLLGALTAEIAHQARMAAAEQPSGRLDPPLSLFLDETPLTCGPVPLHDWTADMGGRGVWIHITAQSLAQLRDCWGPDRANAILGNTSALMVFGGIKSTDDLQQLSTLAGMRLRQLDADDIRPTPVMGPAEIEQLKKGQVMLIINGLRPVIGVPEMGWPTPTRAALTSASQGVATAARAVARTVRESVAWVVEQYRAKAARRRADAERLARAEAQARLVARDRTERLDTAPIPLHDPTRDDPDRDDAGGAEDERPEESA